MTILFLQVGLALYLGNMFKTMVGASKKLQAELAIAGHPNAFPSTPKTTTAEWDLLQTFDYRTLLCTQVLKGNTAVWQSAVADITAEVSDVAGLLRNLAGVRRTVSPTTHATVLLMPSQAFMKTVLEQNPDISNAELVAVMSHAAKTYARYLVNGHLQNPSPAGTDWTLEEALGCCESFYVLEALPHKWSSMHLFKCNCPECFKCASCVHVLLAGMVCDPSIRVPSKNLGITLQRRRARGRPSTKGSEVGDAGEARARARIALQAEYRAPKVCSLFCYSMQGVY